MIRYGGLITHEEKDEFIRFVVNGQICFQRTIEGMSGEFYIVYLTNRADELAFKLKYPKMR